MSVGSGRALSVAARDAGLEVIYQGIRLTPEEIAESALQEDVDVVGLSSLSGAHAELFGDIMAGLREKGLEQVIVVAGGTIPDEDVPVREKRGLRAVSGPATPTADIIERVKALAAQAAP